MTVAEYRKLRKGSRRKAPRVSSGKTWSAPEKRYFYGVLGGVGEYEPEHLRITPPYAEKHVYTPDFVTHLRPSKSIHVYHEVKGSYRLQSQDAARIRFIMASVRHDNAYFVWAKERKNRCWDIEIFSAGELIAEKKNVIGFHFNEEENIVWARKSRVSQ